MKKGFFFSVFSIGLICLGSMGAIERAYNSDNDITYQETSGDVNSSSSDEPINKAITAETSTTVNSNSVTVSWVISNLDQGVYIDNIFLKDTTGTIVGQGSTATSGSYLVSNLTPNTTYIGWTLEVHTISGDEEIIDNFTVENFTTLDDIKLTITNFTVSNIQNTSAKFSWTINPGDAVSIDEISLNYNDPIEGGQVVDTGSVLTSDSYTLTNLKANTAYGVSLVVVWTDYLGVEKHTTDEVGFTTTNKTPLNIAEFTAIEITQYSARLIWNLDMGDAQSIDKIELSYTDPVNGLQTIDTGSVLPADSYTLTGLTPGTLYDVTLTVSWTDYFGNTQTTTDVETFTTSDPIGVSITNFTASDVTETSAILNWNLDMGDAQAIDKIELSYTDPVNGLQTIDTGSVLASDSYTLTGLTPGTLYDVTLIVTWTDVVGIQQTTTDVESFTTLDPIGVSVIDFSASNVTNNSATLNWNLDMGEAQSIDNIQLTYIDPIDGNQLVDTGSVLPSDSYTLTDLKADSTYDVTLIVSWTNFIGDQQTTTEVTSFTTSNATGLSVIDFTSTDVTNNSATLSWNLEMADAQSIDKIELSYTDPVDGLQTIDTGSVLPSDSYTLTGLKADSTYDVTLIVSWTDYLGVQQTTNSDVVSFTTSYEELEIISTNIQADESTNQAIVSWEIEANDSTIENIVVTNSNNEVLAEGSTDAIGSYTIDSSNEENYDWNIIVTYSSPSGTQTTSNETITNVVVNADSELPIFEIVGGAIGIIFVIAIICLIYFISKHRKNIYSLETDETQIDSEALNNETQIDTEPFDNETQINSWM